MSKTDSFMQVDTTEKMYGHECETMSGTYYVPGYVCPVNHVDLSIRPDDLQDFVPDPIIEHKVVKGYFGRLSAPGFLDATDWSFDANRAKLVRYIRTLYGTDD